jgi:hypothetical protein
MQRDFVWKLKRYLLVYNQRVGNLKLDSAKIRLIIKLNSNNILTKEYIHHKVYKFVI